MKLKIKVLRKHITKGVQGALTMCPVALALKDAGCWDVYVNDSELTFARKRGSHYYMPTPERVRAFVDKFDWLKPGPAARKDLKPFSFAINL